MTSRSHRLYQMSFTDPSVFFAVGAMLVSGLLRVCTYTKAKQEDLHDRLGDRTWAAQPYSVFLLGSALYFVSLVFSFVELMRDYNWLDEGYFFRPANNATQPDTLDTMRDFHLPVWIAAACQLTPFAIAGTFVVTALHLREHLQPRRSPWHKLRWLPSLSHDLAIQVIMLPLVFGLFSLDNVVLSLQVFTGNRYFQTVKDTGRDQRDVWKEVTDQLQTAFDINFHLADLYEAWALFCFGQLCFVLVHRQVLLEAPTVKHLIDEVMQHFEELSDQRQQEATAPIRASSESAQEARRTRALANEARDTDRTRLQDLKILKAPDRLLFKPMQDTLRLGVQVLVFTYTFKSLYSLALAATHNLFVPEGKSKMEPEGRLKAICSLLPYIEGAATLASTLAIMNLVILERIVRQVLPRFKPGPKFFFVIVLVSISYFQMYAFDVVLGSILLYSEIQIRFAYACFVCLEVLLVSLGVFSAFRPRPWDTEDWYSEDLNRNADLQHLVDFPYNVRDPFVSKIPKESRQLVTLRSERADQVPRTDTLKLTCEEGLKPEVWDSVANFVRHISNSRVTLSYLPPGFLQGTSMVSAASRSR